MSPSAYARVASGLFAAEAIFPIAHRFAGADYRGFAHVHNVVVDSGLAIVWITAAVAGLTRRSGLALAAMCIGALLSLVHGLMFSVATSSVGPYGVGLPFLFAAIAQTYLIVQAAPAFRHAPEEPREPSPAPSPAPHHARSMA
jgi:hypothetical protein